MDLAQIRSSPQGGPLTGLRARRREAGRSGASDIAGKKIPKWTQTHAMYTKETPGPLSQKYTDVSKGHLKERHQ